MSFIFCYFHQPTFPPFTAFEKFEYYFNLTKRCDVSNVLSLTPPKSVPHAHVRSNAIRTLWAADKLFMSFTESAYTEQELQERSSWEMRFKEGLWERWRWRGDQSNQISEMIKLFTQERHTFNFLLFVRLLFTLHLHANARWHTTDRWIWKWKNLRWRRRKWRCNKQQQGKTERKTNRYYPYVIWQDGLG